MNRAQLRTRTYEISGLQPTDPLATQGMVNRHIDAALRHVAADYDWPWLVIEASIPLVVNVGDYDPGEGWIKTIDLALSQGAELGPLTYISALSLDEMYPYPDQRGNPRHYAIVNNKLRLRPVPDGAMTAMHRYKTGEPPLADDTAEPLMPAEYHDQLVELVAGMALGATRDTRGQDFWARYVAWSKRLRDEHTRKNGAQRIRVRPGGWL